VSGVHTMPLRVLVVSHLYPSARRPTGAPWLAEQVGELARGGVRMSVLCCSPFEPNVDALDSAGARTVQVTYRNTSAGLLNNTRAGLLLSTLRYDARARAFLMGRRDEFDVLHAHFAYPDAFITCRLGAEFGIPVVVTLHGSDVAGVVSRPGAFGGRVRRALGSAAAILCVSEDLAAQVRRALPDHPAIRVAPNGYDDSIFRPAEVKRDLGLLFVGALRPVKNIHPLLEVYLSSPDLHDLPLTIIGAGPLEADLKRTIAASAAGANVRMLGSVPRADVVDAMQRATALVVPSEREGFGVVAAEALACGTPVVASATGGLPDILAGEAAGVLVVPGNRDELLAALRAVREWPHSPAEVAAASGARPWTDRAAEIRAVYDEVVASATRGSHS